MQTESERVYVAISELIRDKRFVAGQPLRESAIASELRVSRTPVREALRRFASEGIVEITPNRGATLVNFTEEDILDIWSLRGLLEPHGARLAAERATPDNVSRLEALYLQMQESIDAKDLDRLTDLNNRFHAKIVDASGSRILRDVSALVRPKTLVRRTFGHYTEAQLQRSQQHHLDIIEAIRAKNGIWAEATMRAHIQAGRETTWSI